MKNVFTLIFSFFLFSSSFADHAELVVYNPNGAPFYLEIDGRRQNQSPRKRVKATQLRRSQYDIRIRFADRRLGQVFFDRVKVVPDHKNVFRLVSRRGNLILDLESRKPLYTPPPAPTYPTAACYEPIDRYHFADLARAIDHQTFENDKIRTAKRMLRNQCVSSRQVRKFMELFAFEKSKLEFAKYCFEKTIDPDRYYVVSEGFSYSSSKRELDRYIERISRDYFPPSQGQGQCTSPHDDHYDDDYDNPYDQGNYGKGHSHGKGQHSHGKGKGNGHYKPKHQNKPHNGGYSNGGSYQGTCSRPISDASFRGGLRDMKMQRHDQAKLRIAKEMISSNCMKSVHIAEFVETLRSESNRLELAKYGYRFVYDPDNYHHVSRALEYGSSARELDRFIR